MKGYKSPQANMVGNKDRQKTSTTERSSLAIDTLEMTLCSETYSVIRRAAVQARVVALRITQVHVPRTTASSVSIYRPFVREQLTATPSGFIDKDSTAGRSNVASFKGLDKGKILLCSSM
jgi:hypothetical protein